MPDNGEAIQLLSGSRRRLDVIVPGENRLIYFGLAVLILVGALFGIVSFYLSSLKDRVAELDNELVTLEGKRDKKFEKEALVWNRRLSLAGGLIKNHIIWSQAMHRVEAVTPSSVEFSNFHAVLQDNMVEVKATAPSYTVIARSIAALSANPVFTDVVLNKISGLPSGFLEYDLRVTFDRNKLLINAPSGESRP